MSGSSSGGGRAGGRRSWWRGRGGRWRGRGRGSFSSGWKGGPSGALNTSTASQRPASPQLVQSTLTNCHYPAWKKYLPNEAFSDGSQSARYVVTFTDYFQAHLSHYNLEEIENKGSLPLDCTSLLSDPTLSASIPDLAGAIRNQPEATLNQMALALHTAFCSNSASQVEIVGEEEGEGEGGLGKSTDAYLNVPRLYIRLHNFKPVISLKSIKAPQYGKCVAVQGTVVRVSNIKPLVTTMAFRCLLCQEIQTVALPDGKYQLPTQCPTAECRGRSFTPLRSSPLTQTIDWQTVRIQEISGDDRREAGRIPRTIECELTADLVDSCVPGDMVTITAVVKATGSEEVGRGRNAKDKCMFLLYLHAISLSNSKASAADASHGLHMDFSTKDYYAIQEIQSDKNVFRLIVGSLCPTIYGHELVKAGLVLGLFGGSQKFVDSKNNIPVRGDPHILIVGDPGLGKSQMLQAAANVTPRGVYVCGNTTTTSGLTVTLTKEGGSGNFALEAGALVLADQGLSPVTCQLQHCNGVLCDDSTTTLVKDPSTGALERPVSLECRPTEEGISISVDGVAQENVKRETNSTTSRTIVALNFTHNTTVVINSIHFTSEDNSKPPLFFHFAVVDRPTGCCCIDEFDKMGSQHQALLEAMEQQSISLAKAGVVCSLPARTSILAAANPVGGHYNRAKTVSENLKMNSALLSRFDLVFILLDNPDEEMDSILSEHVMALHARQHGLSHTHQQARSSLIATARRSQTGGVDTSLDQSHLLLMGEEQASLLDRLKIPRSVATDFDPVPSQLLRKYVGYARKYVHPHLSSEAASEIQKFYLELRKNRQSQDSTPITTRQLESLIRLTEARARLELREEATEQDAKDVIEIMKFSMFYTFSDEFGTLDFQRSQNGSGMSHRSQAKRFISELSRIAEHTSSSTFTVQQLRDIVKRLGLQLRSFEDFIYSLNNQNYLLKKGHKLYQLQTASCL